MRRVPLLLLALLVPWCCFAQLVQNNARMLSTPNAQTGTTYTFVAADTTRIVSFNNPNPVAATLPSGASVGFGGGTMLSVLNLGAGPVTITCSGCTINGAATLIISQSQGADIYGGAGPNGVNYDALVAVATGGVIYPPAGIVTSTGTAFSSVTFPASGVPLSTGSAFGSSYLVQGADAALLSAGTVSGVAAPLCTDANGGATTVGCPSGGGGGASPGGSTGDLQINAGGGNLGAAPFNYNSTTQVTTDSKPLVQSGDTTFGGPNPRVDIRAYGARAVTYNAAPAVPGHTCTINGTSTSMTVSNADFQNNDGIDCAGAGATITLATPSAPTVTPSIAASSTGTGYVVNGPAGSTTDCYKIVWEDAGQGLTAASPAGCSSTSQASLGLQSVSITSSSRSGNVVTVTTSSAHGLPVGCSGLSTCGMVYVSGMTDQSEFGGWYIVSSVPTNTTFTYPTSLSTLNGVISTTSTGGTAAWFNCDHVALGTPPAGARKAYIYASINGGGYSLVDAGMPVSSTISTEPTYQVWDYFGSTMSGNFNRPWWVPSTPPSSALNDTLVTTVTAGGGTTSLTVANAATNSVSGATVLIDTTPALKAAVTAAKNTVNGMVYIPVTAATCPSFVFNSYADIGAITSAASIEQAGPIVLYDTINFGGIQWRGNLNVPNACTITPSFSLESHIPITIATAKPGFLIQNAGTTSIRGVAFNTTASNLENYIFSLQGQPQIFEDDAFAGAGSSDYMGVLLYTFANNGGGFGGYVHKVSFTSGTPSQVTGTPHWISKNTGIEWDVKELFMSNKGVFAAAPYTNVGSCGFQNWDMEKEIQGSVMPVIVLHPNGVGCFVSWTSGVLDTVGQPAVALLSNQAGAISTFSGSPQPSSMPVLSGLPFTSVGTSSTAGSPPAQNFNSVVSTIASFVYDGAFNSPIQTKEYQNHVIGSNYSFFTDTGIPAAPTCTTVAAGPPFTPAGTYTWNFAVQYPNGGLGNLSGTSTSCTANGTSQQLQISAPAITGAVAYSWWVNGTNRPTLNSGGCSGLTVPTTQTFTYTGSLCGFNSTPTAAGGGPAGIEGITEWASTVNISPVTAAPAPNLGVNLFDLNTDNWPAFNVNGGGTKYFLMGFNGTWTPGLCAVANIQVNSFSLGVCGSGSGGGTTLQTNGANNISQTGLNFVNPSSFNGLTFTWSNPSGGNETFTVGGTLANAGLANPSATVNGQTCTLGSSCNVNAGDAAHTVPINEGNGNQLAASNAPTSGLCFMGNGVSSDPSFQACPSGFANPMTTLGDLIYQNGTPTAARLAGPTGPNGVPQFLTDTPAGGAAQAELWSVAGVAVNNNSETTCATQTLNVIDRATAIFCSGGSTSTVTMPVHTTAGFGANFPFVIYNGNSGNMTLSPTTDTVDRATVLPGWAAFLYNNSSGNWQSNQFPAYAAFGSTCGDSSHALAWSTSAGFSCQSISGTGITLQTNTVNNSSQTILNLLNSSATNGLTLTVTNTSAGNVQLGYTGTLNNSGLTNTGTTVNGTTCTLGSSCAPLPNSTGSSDVTAQSTSQSTVNLGTSLTAGHYVITYYADVSAACPSGSNSVNFTFSWTDASLARTLTTGNLPMSTSNTASNYLSGTFDVWAAASSSISYTSTIGSCASGTSTYDIHATLERLR